MACPDCFSGTEHLGNPVGTIETIHGLKCYVTKPEGTPKGLVVYIPDAFGWEFTNNRILADHYAKRGGFLVYLPDFMGGSSLAFSVLGQMEELQKPASWFTTLFYKPIIVLKLMRTVIPWLISVRPSVVKPRLISFFQALRINAPPWPTKELKIGAAGFCWGGKFTVVLAQDDPSTRVLRHESQEALASQHPRPLIDCAFTAHPSNLSMPSDIEAVKLPLSVAIGNEDMVMKGPIILNMKETLEVKNRGDHEVVIMPGAKHGFAVRTHPEDKEQMACAEQAEEQAVAWFTRWLT